METGDAAPPAAQRRDAGPNVSPTAAPGVAFNYRYSFRLPAERIGEVQKRHAATCEQLGVRRCRITGMLYRVVGENDVEAMLSFSLDRHRPPFRPRRSPGRHPGRRHADREHDHRRGCRQRH